MSTYNICFYGEISKIMPYHQISSLSVPLRLHRKSDSKIITVKTLKIWTPENNVVIILKFEQCGFIIRLWRWRQNVQ